MKKVKVVELMSLRYRLVEIVLNVLSIVVILFVPHAWVAGHVILETLLVAVVIIVFHAGVCWLMWYRIDLQRQRLINDVRLMLQDKIRSPLATITINLELIKYPDASREAGQILRAIDHINAALDLVSEEAVRAWRTKYPEN